MPLSPARLFASIRHKPVRAALSNLFWLAGERGTQLFVTIIISGLLARYLGAAGFGQWQYAMSLLTVLSPLTWVCGAELLVPAIVATMHGTPVTTATPGASAGGAPARGTLLGSAFVLRMGMAIATLLIVFAVMFIGQHTGRQAHFFDPMVSAMLAGLLLTMLFREPFGVVSAWLQARTHSKPALLLTLLAALCKALAVWCLVRLASPPGAFGWLWAIEAAAIAAGLMWYYHRYYRQTGVDQRSPDLRWLHFADWQVETALLRRFVRAGAVFWLGLIAMYVFMKLDRLMLVHYVSFAELGRYAAAQQLNENWITLAMMLAQTVAPAFIYQIDDRTVLRRNLLRLLLLTAAVMACGALLISVLAAPLVHLVFGNGFQSAAALLRWAAWLSVLAGIDAICNLVMLKYQAARIVLLKWTLALLTTFLCNLLFIPHFGNIGALLGLLAGYIAVLLVDAGYLYTALRHAAPLAHE